MKILFAFLTLLSLTTTAASAQAEDQRVVIDYRYGNKITSSEVIVLTSGLVIQKRRQQATYVYLPNVQLSQKEVSELISAVDATDLALPVYIEGELTAFGSSSGLLVGYTTNGKRTFIFSASLDKVGSQNKLSYQPGADGDKVRMFIQNLVTDKMPLDIIAP